MAEGYVLVATVTKHGKGLPHPTTQLLRILERHGLTVDILEAWVQFLEAKKTGSVTFHSTEGYLQQYEERGYLVMRTRDVRSKDKSP